ncbi:MAG: hypothetical protein ABR923_06145 [Terracidiphilus sp.]
MSFKFRQLDPKSRRLIAAGNLCLAAGLLILNLPHPANQTERNWFHGIGGFLIGLSISISLSALFVARRCNWIDRAEHNSPVAH